ncbi:ribosomal-processing cysteine protease Prp [Staphylococcus canis]|uniref:Ribosomal processing cysteine protease Prp n=1 Tax=Staphylococcus canis TaxID=2724942 RepID=A0ABS0T605_9STAP|nr:ribosomal-processing cysteine protease Prp [Staphylococcus canis]MBI5974185.1 ribosomal-processing cysteine protease Prp [Staphylococcus canis]
MINVDISLNDEGQVSDVIMTGHADYAEHGQDIVCAGASAVLFGSINAIMGLTSEKPDIDYDDEGGYFHVRSVDPSNEQAQLILQAMIVSLQTMEDEYKDYIKLNLK